MLPVLRELLPFLAALYLLDCLTLARRGQCLLSCCFGLDFRLWQGGLAIAGVLPLDEVFLLARSRVLVTGERLYLPPVGARGGNAYRRELWTPVPYTDAAVATVEGREVRFGAGGRLRLATAAEARDLGDFLRELVALSPDGRESHAAAAAARALGVEQVRARHAAFETASSPLIALGWALFCTLFVALPPLVYLGVPPPWLTGTLLGGTALLWMATAAAAAWVARRLRHQGLIGGDGALLAICLSLPSAMRAALHLGHDLLHGCDFAAAAAALLPHRTVIPLLRAELHGARCAAADAADAGWQRAWEERRRQLVRLTCDLELSEDELLAPPPRREPEAAAYCPFCQSEFLPGPALCDDCGTPLQPYGPAAAR